MTGRVGAGASALVVAVACLAVVARPSLVAGGDRAAPLRQAVRSFVAAERTGRGFDNGVTRGRRFGIAEARLSAVASDAPARDAAQAYDLLGVLAWGGTSAPAGVTAPADRSVDAFTTAVRTDPSDVAAKTNLEIALRALQAHSSRTGSSPGAGTGAGRRGAGAGVPGRGY